MPQVTVNSANIGDFFFSVKFDIYNRKIIFDTSGTTYFGSSGSGLFNVFGISFLLQDQDGITLTEVNFTDPTKYIVPSVEMEYIVDVSSLPFNFLFQTYTIIGTIKDQNGAEYSTTAIYKKLCEPVGFTDGGYVPGMFDVRVSCHDNTITVKEITLFILNKQTPVSKTKSGNLYYPTGTLSPIAFTNTPFTNNQVYTGQYRVVNDTTATYDLGDDVTIDIVYRTNNVFDMTCSNKIGDLMCCIIDLQKTYDNNCNNNIGKNAKQKLDSIIIPFLSGLAQEINGQDASAQAALIRKTLNCNCGANAISQNEMTPINPTVYNFVLIGVGGTSIGPATVTGNTKTFTVVSNVYQVVKGNTGDLAFTITTDTSTANTVKYKITFNYTIQAGYILNAIAANGVLLTQLNSLINFTNANFDLNPLNGKCVIDLSSLNYFLSYKVISGGDIFKNVKINGTTYTPTPFPVNAVGSIEGYLNGLGLGVFQVGFANGVTGAYFNIISTANSNLLETITLTIGGNDTVVPFQKTNKSLIAVLQAIIDYLCGLTALQMALGNNLSLCTFDYNGNVVTTSYAGSVSQNTFNAGVAFAICNLANRILTLTAVTCARLKTVYVDNANASFAGGVARVHGVDQDGNCVAYTVEQLGLSIINSVNSYSTIKTAFCSIDCGTPATCPEVSTISLAMAGSNIGVYGVTWVNTPSAVQTVTVRHKLLSDVAWITDTSSLLILPNGTISGTTPFQISGVTPGSTYQVWVQNNCGGAGKISQITVPTSSLFSGDFLLDNIIYNICGQTPVTLYSAAPFGAGTVMYTDAGLTTVVTGFTYISPSSGSIFTLNTSTGQVGVDSGLDCNNGTAGNYRLGNNTGTICAASTTTLYTNGVFAVGGTIYTDAGLSNPVTGSSYVVAENGHIYNLNTSTGVIGADTGLTCTNNYTLSGAFQFGIDSVTGVGVPSLPPVPPNTSASGFHTGISGMLAIQVTGTHVVTTKITIYVAGVPVDCEVIPSTGTHNFSMGPVTASSAQDVFIAVESGIC